MVAEPIELVGVLILLILHTPSPSIDLRREAFRELWWYFVINETLPVHSGVGARVESRICR